MSQTADAKFLEQAQLLGYSFEGDIKIGGNYVPLVRDGNHIYVSGQIPRVDNTVVVTGDVGADVSLADAQKAAKVCVMRALALLQLADGASELLFAVLGEQVGAHSRTSVGVLQLPKNASVEIDLIASVRTA